MSAVKSFIHQHPRLARLLPAIAMALFMALALPIALTMQAAAPLISAVPGGEAVASWMIQTSLAQTYTVGTLSTEVAGALGSFIPSYQVYITLGVVFLLAAYAFRRFMSSGR